MIEKKNAYKQDLNTLVDCNQISKNKDIWSLTPQDIQYTSIIQL